MVHDDGPVGLDAMQVTFDDERAVSDADYNLAPRSFANDVSPVPLWTARWNLAVPAHDESAGTGELSPRLLRRYADANWIVNSRNTADENVVVALAALAGFAPRVTHRVDSLELVEDLIAADLGIALLPADKPPCDGVQVLDLHDPDVELRSYAVARRGRETWAPLALVTRLIEDSASPRN